ncbi:hypothetical protein SALBM217S_05508 [Streptomyces griseoloalbus]
MPVRADGHQTTAGAVPQPQDGHPRVGHVRRWSGVALQQQVHTLDHGGDGGVGVGRSGKRVLRRVAATSPGTWQCRATRSALVRSATRTAASRWRRIGPGGVQDDDSPEDSRADARSSRAE